MPSAESIQIFVGNLLLPRSRAMANNLTLTFTTFLFPLYSVSERGIRLYFHLRGCVKDALNGWEDSRNLTKRENWVARPLPVPARHELPTAKTALADLALQRSCVFFLFDFRRIECISTTSVAFRSTLVVLPTIPLCWRFHLRYKWK